MDENGASINEAINKNETAGKNFIAFIAIALSVASIITALCNVEYFSVILGIIAIVISIIFLVKKLGIKWFGIGALLLGIIGAVLGIPRTFAYMSAQFGWAGESVIESAENDASANAAQINEAAEKFKACLEEAGIDPEANYDDLAEEQKDAHDACL